MKDDLSTLRHSTAHVLAQAVKRLYPDVKLGIGPNVEEGFYYDFDKAEPFTPEDLKKIEKEMHKIIGANFKFEKSASSKSEAKAKLKGEPYKLELLNDIDEPTFYKDGEFVDLCRGPHVESTGKISAFKLLKISGAYWRGDQKNRQMQRIYGTAFGSDKELKAYLNLIEEAEKRDHRKLGKELELFMFHEWSPGNPFLLPKGAVIYNELLKFIRNEYAKHGYQEVVTPQLFNKALWEASGHWEHYKDDMFTMKIDNEEFSLKPMNCPSHILIFKNSIKSYRDLPLRIADFCMLHRNELRGVLGGMTRVRKFSQDDAHIFCTPEQIESEIKNLLEFIKYVYKDVFKFEYTANLSTKPEKAMGSDELWQNAEKALSDVLTKTGMKFNLKPGEGAFYGPKIDFQVKDALGRMWQLATIQLDFQMPGRLEATYEGPDGKKHTPVMIHRAILGSVERFMGVLIEHYAGKFPLWLSPVQVKILTMNEEVVKFAENIKNEMESCGLRVELDSRNETIGRKVREAQLEKASYMVTIGSKEVEKDVLAVRDREGKVTFGVKPKNFIKELLDKIESKS